MMRAERLLNAARAERALRVDLDEDWPAAHRARRHALVCRIEGWWRVPRGRQGRPVMVLMVLAAAAEEGRRRARPWRDGGAVAWRALSLRRGAAGGVVVGRRRVVGC